MTKRPFASLTHAGAALLAALALPASSYAALGAAPSVAQTAQLRAAPVTADHVIAAATHYTSVSATLSSGTTVTEYVGSDGLVFAVRWDGPFRPDFKELLGTYHGTFLQEAAKQAQGRTQLRVRTPGLAISSVGHMRSFHGTAWLPEALPAGFDFNEVK